MTKGQKTSLVIAIAIALCISPWDKPLGDALQSLSFSLVIWLLGVTFVRASKSEEITKPEHSAPTE
jgi:hypothetical protein